MTCDGSVRNNQGSYGFVIIDEEHESIIQGFGKVHKTYNEHTSQRAEFYGTAAFVIVYKILIQRFNLSPVQRNKVYIDNEGVVEDLSEDERKPGLKVHLAPDTEMSVLIKSILQQVKATIEWIWIKGHQDRNTIMQIINVLHRRY